MTMLLDWIELATLGVELLAIGIILVAVLFGTVRYLTQSLARPPQPKAYDQYKVRLGKALLLGLEILVAADIVRTVALEPTLESISVLGILVVIRTFLSWSLVVEIEGRWPWQARAEREPPTIGDES